MDETGLHDGESREPLHAETHRSWDDVSSSRAHCGRASMLIPVRSLHGRRQHRQDDDNTVSINRSPTTRQTTSTRHSPTPPHWLVSGVYTSFLFHSFCTDIPPCANLSAQHLHQRSSVCTTHIIAGTSNMGKSITRSLAYMLTSSQSATLLRAHQLGLDQAFQGTSHDLESHCTPTSADITLCDFAVSIEDILTVSYDVWRRLQPALTGPRYFPMHSLWREVMYRLQRTWSPAEIMWFIVSTPGLKLFIC